MTDASLKTGWNSVQFGALAENVNDRVDDPRTAGVERYVGLEHLDPDSLSITRWGSPTDVEASKLRFRSGDIIFGRRRAYQRKLAVADFEGICSAHAMVLRERPGAVAPGFLPFFMHSDVFMSRAISISVGSLSPTINWTTLRDEVFAIPPLDQQRRIVRGAHAAFAAIDAAKELVSRAANVRDAGLASLVSGGRYGDASSLIDTVALPEGWRVARIDSLCTAPVTSGTTPRAGKSSEDTGHPFVRVQNLTFNGQLAFGASPEWVDRKAFTESTSRHVAPQDILINIVGPPLGKVSVVPHDFPNALINQAIVRFRVGDRDTRAFVLGYLMSSWAKRWLHVHSTKTSGQRNINVTTASRLPVPVPPVNVLKEIVDNMDTLRAAQEAAHRRLIESTQLYNMLLNQPV